MKLEFVALPRNLLNQHYTQTIFFSTFSLDFRGKCLFLEKNLFFVIFSTLNLLLSQKHITFILRNTEWKGNQRGRYNFIKCFIVRPFKRLIPWIHHPYILGKCEQQYKCMHVIKKSLNSRIFSWLSVWHEKDKSWDKSCHNQKIALCI